LQALAGIEHSMVLDGRTDDVVAIAHKPEYGEIVTLSAAAGEYNLGRTATQQRSHRLSCAFDCAPRLLPMMMDG
jgi:hypothetical protein